MTNQNTNHKKTLTPEEHYVCHQKGTESPFSGQYWDHHEQGVYTCKCCGEKLFESETKFDSGTGWPSFFKPALPDAVGEKEDTSHGMRRIEALCKNCGAHLGHVFPDGPKPTGLRYCINSLSLDFKKEEKKK